LVQHRTATLASGGPIETSPAKWGEKEGVSTITC